MTPRRLLLGSILLAAVIATLAAVVLLEDVDRPRSQQDVGEQGQLIDLNADGPFPFTPGIYLLDTETGDIRRVLHQKGDDSFSHRPSYQWSEDGEWLVSASIGNRDKIVAVSKDGSRRREADGNAWTVDRLDDGDFVLHMRPLDITGGQQPEILGRLDLDTMTVTEIHKGSGAEAVSPSGKYVARSTGRAAANGGSIELIDVASGMHSTLLVPPSRDQSFNLDAASTWSADSKRILAFHSGMEGEYVVLDVEQRSELSRFPAQPMAAAAWSPDGRYIAYANWVEGVSWYPPDGTLDVWDLQTQTARSLGRGTSPSWSDDGGSLAFVRAGELWRVDLASGKEERLFAAQLPVIDEPRWSPDGRYVAFRSRGGGSEIWQIDIDGRNERYLGLGWEPVSSPDGSRIAFLNGFGGLGFSGALYTMASDGTDIRSVGTVGFGDALPICFDRRISWSPDGRSLAYNRGMESIAVAAADGLSVPVSLGEGTGPFWTRDGGRVLFVRRMGASPPGCGIISKPAAGGAESLVVAGMREATVSPDGRYLLGELDSFRGGSSVAIMETADVTQRTEIPNAWDPSWSPSSSEFVYLNLEGGKGSIFPPYGVPGAIVVVPLDDPFTPRVTVPVTSAPADVRWAPDGQSLAYSADTDQGTFIYVVRLADPANPIRLTEGMQPSWSPDGETIVFTRYYSQ